VNSKTVVPLLVVLALPACKKSDAPTDGTAASGTAQAAAAATATPLGNFEGEIDLLAKSSENPKPVPPLNLLVKAGKVRMDIPEGMSAGKQIGKGYLIASPSDKKVYIVSDAQKQVISLDLAALGDRMKQLNPAAAAAPSKPTTPPTITKTGKMETVAGRSCEDWNIVSGDGEHGVACVSTEGVSWLDLPSLGAHEDQAWMRQLFDGQHMPLRFVGYKKDGTEDGSLEVTKIEAKPVADAMFQLPPSYPVLDLDQMFKHLGMPNGFPTGMPPGAMPGMPTMPGMPSAVAVPPGMTLPPNIKLPPGVTLPPNMKLPPGMTEDMLKQLRARMGQQPAPQ
jgi:hypothetical protein